jgi:DNA polymerase
MIEEMFEVLGHLREQAHYLRELGADTIDLDRVPDQKSSTGSKAAVAASDRTIPKVDVSAKNVAIPEEKFAQRPQRVTPVLSGSANTLFGDLDSPKLPPESAETLEDVWRDIGDCTRCGLCEGRTQVVNTFGNTQARLMFVGEAPGADEDAQGKPFVGRAGQLLTKIIEAIGMKREEVLIGNVNRCRPPGNRQPTLEEAAICRPFLFREIAAVQPEVIVVLGNTALRNLLEIREGITRVRGKFQDFRGIKVMPTFHPAYLLRDPSKKRETWEDLKRVRDYLDEHPKPSQQI